MLALSTRQNGECQGIVSFFGKLNFDIIRCSPHIQVPLGEVKTDCGKIILLIHT